MSIVRSLSRGLSRLVWDLLSVPIIFKVLGIGALVAVVFGGISLYLTRNGTMGIHSLALAHRASDTAEKYARSLESPMATGDVFAVHQMVDSLLRSTSGLRYLIVKDRTGRVIAHTFERAVPTDLLAAPPALRSEHAVTEILMTDEGLVFCARAPILKGQGGAVELGLADRRLRGQSESLTTRLILGALIFSMAVGLTFTLLLTHLLTYPIFHLKQVAERMRAGDFDAQARIFSADEIGSLAQSFNRLGQSLRAYRAEVREKEAARASLIGKIVGAQEEERKHLARELHDQLGQSLSKVLLTFVGARGACGCRDSQCADLESEMRGLIDETRRLAWDMRPPVLDDYGLDSALGQYFKDMAKRMNIPIEYQCVSSNGPRRLPNQIESTLYRIAQEATTNILRHAHASRVSVVFLNQDSQVRLVIEDNGCGFDVGAAHAGSAHPLGLLSMKERAALVGGEVEIESQLGKGTEVLVTIPAASVAASSGQKV